LKLTSFENNKNYVGKIVEVLIDKEKDGSYFGHTRTYKNVKLPISLSLIRRGAGGEVEG
jgi:tRNA A37 methylthiotransferase MiaB